MNNKRLIVLSVLNIIVYVPMAYVMFFDVGAGIPNASGEWNVSDLWVLIAPIGAIILWIWSLYDWGTRGFVIWQKLIWLLVLITTSVFGATLYFIVVGLKSRQKA